MKKILTIILTIILAFNFSAALTSASFDNSVLARGTREKELLKAISVIDEEKHTDEHVTRAEFLRLVLRLINPHEEFYPKPAPKIFYDLDGKDEYAPIVYYAYSIGIIKDSDMFRPYRLISYGEACTMIIRALGYTVRAEAMGGFPAGYTTMASQLGILKGVNVRDEYLTYEDTIKLLYNSLFAQVFQKLSDKTFETVNKTYLEVFHGVYSVKGIIEATSICSLYENMPLQRGYIQIDDTLYKLKNNDFILPGYEARVYYREENGENLVLHIDITENNTLELDLDIVESYALGEILYIEDGKTKRCEVNPNAKTFINHVATNITGKAVLPAQGRLVLVDNNHDNRMDAVFIYEMKIMVASYISIINNTISGKYATYGTLKLEDYDEVRITDSEGTVKSIEDINKDDVLMVYAASDNHRIDIEISTKKAEVYVVELATEKDFRGNTYYTIVSDERTYRTLAVFEKNEGLGSLKLNAYHVFYLDALDRIVGIYEHSRDEGWKFGYLCGALYEGNISKRAKVRIFTENGEFIEPVSAGKVNVEGIGLTSPAGFVAMAGRPGLICYRLNSEGELAGVEFAADFGEKDVGFRCVGAIEDLTQNAANRYYANPSLIGGRIAMDNNTKVILVPPNSEIDDTDKFMKLDMNYFVNGQYYPMVRGYSTTNSPVSEIVVCTYQSVPIKASDRNMLVTRISTYHDALTGKESIKIYGYVDGKEVGYLLSSDTKAEYTPVSTNQPIQLESGDAIKLSFNINGEIDTIKLMYDVSTRTVYGNKDTNDSTTLYGASFRHISGQVYKKYNDYFSIIRDFETESLGELYSMEKMKYLYEVSYTDYGNIRVRTMSPSELSSLEENSNMTDRIFMFMNQHTIQMAVLYK